MNDYNILQNDVIATKQFFIPDLCTSAILIDGYSSDPFLVKFFISYNGLDERHALYLDPADWGVTQQPTGKLVDVARMLNLNTLLKSINASQRLSLIYDIPDEAMEECLVMLTKYTFDKEQHSHSYYRQQEYLENRKRKKSSMLLKSSFSSQGSK